MAAVTADDIRRAYYDQPGVPYSMWVTEVQLAPVAQLIVANESTNELFRIGYSIGADGTITFADPVQVSINYEDVAAAVAAAKAGGRPVRASARRTGGYDAAQVKRVNAACRVIQAALERGALSPRSALSWAARYGRGEDVTAAVAAMTGSAWLREENKRVRAHSNSQIVQQIMDLLSQAVDGAPEPDDEFDYLFPPSMNTTRTTLIYDAPDRDTGKRPAPRTVDPAIVPPGYEYGTTSNQTNRWASAGHRDRYDPAVQGITDAEADRLFPGQGRTEAEAIARYRGAVAAGAVRPYSDGDLHDLLFGPGES
jgi:hypothetical protein